MTHLRKSTTRLAAVAVILAAVAACDWPRQGHGGADDTAVYRRTDVARGDELATRLDMATGRLATFRATGVAASCPAAYERATGLWRRVAREWSGGLAADARHHLNALEADLEYLSQTCNPVPADATPGKGAGAGDQQGSVL